jgi:hypothetical protein
MAAVLKQANFQLPEDLIKDIQEIVGKRGQSKFVSAALKRELQRLRLIKALDASFGAWSKEKHPELAKGTDNFIRNSRKSSRGKHNEAGDSH